MEGRALENVDTKQEDQEQATTTSYSTNKEVEKLAQIAEVMELARGDTQEQGLDT